MAMITHAQREHFIKRINEILQPQIEAIEHKLAPQKAKAEEKHAKVYYKGIGIDEWWQQWHNLEGEIKEKEKEKDVLFNKMKKVVDKLPHTSPHRYISEMYQMETELDKNKLALVGDYLDDTPEARKLGIILDAKTKAIDFIYGMHKDSEILTGLNEVLKPIKLKLGA